MFCMDGICSICYLLISGLTEMEASLRSNKRNNLSLFSCSLQSILGFDLILVRVMGQRLCICARQAT